MKLSQCLISTSAALLLIAAFSSYADDRQPSTSQERANAECDQKQINVIERKARILGMQEASDPYFVLSKIYNKVNADLTNYIKANCSNVKIVQARAVIAKERGYEDVKRYMREAKLGQRLCDKITYYKAAYAFGVTYGELAKKSDNNKYGNLDELTKKSLVFFRSHCWNYSHMRQAFEKGYKKGLTQQAM